MSIKRYVPDVLKWAQASMLPHLEAMSYFQMPFHLALDGSTPWVQSDTTNHIEPDKADEDGMDTWREILAGVGLKLFILRKAWDAA